MSIEGVIVITMNENEGTLSTTEQELGMRRAKKATAMGRQASPRPSAGQETKAQRGRSATWHAALSSSFVLFHLTTVSFCLVSFCLTLFCFPSPDVISPYLLCFHSPASTPGSGLTLLLERNCPHAFHCHLGHGRPATPLPCVCA